MPHIACWSGPCYSAVLAINPLSLAGGRITARQSPLLAGARLLTPRIFIHKRLASDDRASVINTPTGAHAFM